MLHSYDSPNCITNIRFVIAWLQWLQSFFFWTVNSANHKDRWLINFRPTAGIKLWLHSFIEIQSIPHSHHSLRWEITSHTNSSIELYINFDIFWACTNYNSISPKNSSEALAGCHHFNSIECEFYKLSTEVFVIVVSRLVRYFLLFHRDIGGWSKRSHSSHQHGSTAAESV